MEEATQATGRLETINDAVIRIAGNSQDGIQSVGAMLARLAGRSEMEVMTYMTIPATISGGPSIFQVHMGSGRVLSAGDAADILVVFYQHSYEAHLETLRDGGILIYDSNDVEPDMALLRRRRITAAPVPMTSLTIEILGGTGKQKGKNIFLLGILGRIFRLDMKKCGGCWKKNSETRTNRSCAAPCWPWRAATPTNWATCCPCLRSLRRNRAISSRTWSP